MGDMEVVAMVMWRMWAAWGAFSFSGLVDLPGSFLIKNYLNDMDGLS